jgi:PAS domain-containing protein
VTAHSISVNWEVATPDYFRAAGTRLLEGRSFTDYDTVDAPKVVVVSESLARRGWPGQSPIGKRLNTYGAASELKDGTFVNVEWQTVVGVVEDARYRGIQNPRPDVYLADGQAPASVQYLVVRTTGDPLALAGAVREQVPITFDERIIRPSGEIRHLHSWGSIVVDTDGQPEEMRGACLDLTELVTTTEGLRRTGEWLAVTIENVRIAVFEWNVRTNDVRWSPGSERATGVTALPPPRTTGKARQRRDARAPQQRRARCRAP